MLPIAFAVVEGEIRDSWEWFLKLMIKDLGGEHVCATYTFIADQQKGLLPAINELLPGVDQRFCVRHLYNHFRKNYPGKQLKHLMWKAARATYPKAWEKEMHEIKKLNVDAFKHLNKILPRFWSKSRFKPTPQCDALVNNMSEAFNSVIVEARGKPIITMLEEIRVYLEKWAANRKKIVEFEGDILPKIQKKLDKECLSTRYWIPSWSGEQTFEVRNIDLSGDKFVVNLKEMGCSCRKWMLTGIPCYHAVSCMNYMNMKPQDYIPPCYRKARYEEVYAPMLYPVNDPQLW